MRDTLKFRISDETIGAYEQFAPLNSLADTYFDSIGSVKKARKLITNFRKSHKQTDIKPLLKELDTIADNLEWALSQRG